ncbi:hypothetical protein CYMTET_31709 [Cymbomonas tetramitiformis]|uniref:Uncharacterized protein n=1 Tax=Cymbomonas tetramitiformis TaxID=36881 RepID=A0AAE0FGR8_9CHLO|nr:hypothetical protein CYMTET_31709 [Cymbomonas tetramitiformis]
MSGDSVQPPNSVPPLDSAWTPAPRAGRAHLNTPPESSEDLGEAGGSPRPGKDKTEPPQCDWLRRAHPDNYSTLLQLQEAITHVQRLPTGKMMGTLVWDQLLRQFCVRATTTSESLNIATSALESVGMIKGRVEVAAWHWRKEESSPPALLLVNEGRADQGSS